VVHTRVRIVLPRFGQWLVILALVISSVGHWFALQSVAWLTMAVQFARTDPLDVALEKTFGGSHPCGLCKTVEAGRKSEQKRPVLKAEAKLEFCFNRQAVTVQAPPLEAQSILDLDSFPVSRTEAPPTPPPRLV
jgi:hypothetical protein